MTETENQQSQKGLVWVGEQLKTARKQRKMTLLQVAKTTRINVHVLEEIESGQLKKSPSAVFLRGFIRTYSELLNVDDEAFRQELDRIPELQEVPSHDSQILTPINADEKGTRTKPFVIVSLLIVLGGGYFLFDTYWESIVSIFDDTSSGTTTQNEAKNEASPSKVQPNKIQQNTQTTKKPATNTFVQANPSTPKPDPVQRVIEEKTITPLPPPKKENVIQETVAKLDPAKQKTEEESISSIEKEREDLAVEQITATRIPTTTLIPPKPIDTLILRVLAINPSWLNIRVDKQSSLDVLLQAGEDYSLEAQDQFLLTIGNTKEVEVFLNGKLQIINQTTDLLENWILDRSTLKRQ